MRVAACSTICPTIYSSLARLLPSLSLGFVDSMALSNDHSVRKHAYEALESSQHIRLIILHPASSADAPLKFTFQQARVSELQGGYEAISYTWGQPNRTYPLYVSDGTHVLVTENLDRALRYLRHSHGDRPLWADAACINQADDVEKSAQIPLMVQIFYRARAVLVWLDPGSAVGLRPDLELTMRKMDCVSQTRRQGVLPGSRIETEGNGKDDNAPSLELLGEMSELLRLPWFTRRWIVQEVVFNPEVRLIYGDVELSWAQFVVTISTLSALCDLTRNNPCPKVWSAVTKILQLWRYYSQYEIFPNGDMESPDTDIVKLLDDFDQNECTDPRDRIFAMYNMASNLRPSTSTSLRQDVLMDIDYSLDLQQTYEAFARACIRTGKDSAIIEALLSREYSARPHGWVSWAPDWRVSWAEPVILPRRWYNSVSWAPEYDNWPPGIMPMRLETCRYLLDVEYKAYPIILTKAVGDTLLQQCSNLCTKITRSNAAGDLSVLFDMLRYLKRQYDPWIDPDMRVVLEQQLQRIRSTVYATVSQQDPNLHLMNLDALQTLLDIIIGQSKNIFLFEIPGAERQSVGYGNAHLEVGDQLVPLYEEEEGRASYSWLETEKVKMVLILRCAGTINIKHSPETVYRLIGRGYVYNTADEGNRYYSVGYQTVSLA